MTEHGRRASWVGCTTAVFHTETVQMPGVDPEEPQHFRRGRAGAVREVRVLCSGCTDGLTHANAAKGEKKQWIAAGVKVDCTSINQPPAAVWRPSL